MSNLLQTIWSDINLELDAFWTWTKNFFNTTVKAEVQALAPLAEKALAELGIDFATAQKPSDIATAVGQVAKSVASQAEATGLQVAASSLITAVGGAIANAQAAAATPAPTPSVAVTADSTRTVVS